MERRNRRGKRESILVAREMGGSKVGGPPTSKKKSLGGNFLRPVDAPTRGGSKLAE